MKMNLMKQREKKEKTPKHPQGKASSQEQWWACHPDSPYRLKGCSSNKKVCQDQARERKSYPREEFLRTKVLELAEEGIIPFQAVKPAKKIAKPPRGEKSSCDSF